MGNATHAGGVRPDTAKLWFVVVCIIVAGVYGAMTATKAAFFSRTIPAMLALVVLWAGY